MSGETGETVPAATFQEYEVFCNNGNTSSRKAGILDEALYNDALQDSRTILVEVSGKTMPLIVDIEHGRGLGYETARAKEYANDQLNISALALPITGLDEHDARAVINGVANYSGALYFSDHNGDDKEVLFNGLSERGRTARERPLLDSRANNSQATLSL